MPCVSAEAKQEVLKRNVIPDKVKQQVQLGMCKVYLIQLHKYLGLLLTTLISLPSIWLHCFDVARK
jgi:hypothetical protein